MRRIIADYLIGLGESRTSAQAMRAHLAHIVSYIVALEASNVRARNIDEARITRFRQWLLDEPSLAGKTPKVRSPAIIENSVVELAAALSWARETVSFRPIPLKDLNNSPSYRKDVATLAAMFNYALASERRASLLAFLRLGVISWGRPDAIMDAST